MPLIDFLRHGETEPPGLLLGRTDAPISESGWRKLAQQASERSWDLIISSSLARARVPAERLALEHKVALRIDPDWAELDFGAWDGRPLAELSADPAIASAMDALYRSPQAWAPPGGESWESLHARTSRALSWLVHQSAIERVLIVTHAGPIRAAVALACDIPFERLWSLRVAHAARLTLRIGTEDNGRFWGEIVELVQA